MFPPSAIVEAQWIARERDLQRYVCGAAAVLDARPRDRGRRAAHLPALRNGRDPVEPAVRRLAVGRWRKDADNPTPTSPARQRLAARYDLSLPANQRKLDAAEALAQLADEAGMSLIEMAIAFVINHPAVTAAIIGPRTMEQLESQLPARRAQALRRRTRPHRRDRDARRKHQPRRRRMGQPRPAGNGATTVSSRHRTASAPSGHAHRGDTTCRSPRTP